MKLSANKFASVIIGKKVLVTFFHKLSKKFSGIFNAEEVEVTISGSGSNKTYTYKKIAAK